MPASGCWPLPGQLCRLLQFQCLQAVTSILTGVDTEAAVPSFLGSTNAERALLPKLICPGAAPACPGAVSGCPGGLSACPGAEPICPIPGPLASTACPRLSLKRKAAQFAKVWSLCREVCSRASCCDCTPASVGLGRAGLSVGPTGLIGSEPGGAVKGGCQAVGMAVCNPKPGPFGKPARHQRPESGSPPRKVDLVEQTLSKRTSSQDGWAGLWLMFIASKFIRLAAWKLTCMG